MSLTTPSKLETAVATGILNGVSAVANFASTIGNITARKAAAVAMGVTAMTSIGMANSPASASAEIISTPAEEDQVDQAKQFVLDIDAEGNKNRKLEVEDVTLVVPEGSEDVTSTLKTLFDRYNADELSQEEIARIIKHNPGTEVLFEAYAAETEDSSADTSDSAEQIIADIIAQTEQSLVNAGSTPEEAKWIATTNAKNWLKTAEARATAEQITQQEISEEVEAKLNEIGVTKESVTLVTDVTSNFPGERETGEHSFNHGTAPANITEGLAQYKDILTAQNGFSQEDANVVIESLKKRGVTDEVIEAMKQGDFSAVKFTQFTLNNDSATYKNIDFNKDGKLSVDDLRAVNGQDAFKIMQFTVTIDGKEQVITIATRTDCGEQPFDSFDVPTPEVETPAPEPTPAAPVVNPPEVVPQSFSASYCPGLGEDGQPLPNVEITGYATQEAADQAAAELEQPCEPVEETTTTTTTTAPTTTTTTTAPTTTTTPPVETPKFEECDTNEDGLIDERDNTADQPEHCTPNENEEGEQGPPIEAPGGEPVEPGEEEPPQVIGATGNRASGKTDVSIPGRIGSAIGVYNQETGKVNTLVRDALIALSGIVPIAAGVALNRRKVAKGIKL